MLQYLRRVVLTVAVVNLAVTSMVIVLPGLRFAYARPSLHVAVETANALIALLVAYLVYGRLARRPELREALLAISLSLFALANLALSALPSALQETPLDAFTSWTAVIARVFAAALFAAAALAPRRRLPRRAHSSSTAVLLALAAFALVIAVGAAASPFLPDSPAPREPPTEAFVSAPAPLLGAQALQILVLGVAALGFLRQAERDHDELYGWLAVAATFAVASRVNYLLYPSLYSDWVYTGDVFRVLFYVTMLVGALREIRKYWSGAARVAVLEERRRLARELHDGLAQELAFVVGRSGRLARDGDPVALQVRAASERALDEARRAVAALTRPLDEPFSKTLGEGVEVVARRAGAAVELRLEDVELDAATAVELSRIACEAVANAARHGAASCIRVELTQRDRIVLRVVDDGVGFDPAGVAAERFGLASMRDRAGLIGATLDIRSAVGSGTTVEVLL